MAGKKPLTDRPIFWKNSIPSSVALAVELRLTDPLTGKPAHGARSQLITKLLREWLNEQQKKEIPNERTT